MKILNGQCSYNTPPMEIKLVKNALGQWKWEEVLTPESKKWHPERSIWYPFKWMAKNDAKRYFIERHQEKQEQVIVAEEGYTP